MAARDFATQGGNYLTHSHGVRSWLLSLDHKRIGVMYLVSILAAILVGWMFALLMRTELLTSGPTIFRSADTYNRLFTLHGIVMIFLFVIPGIPAALGNFVLPIMLGANNVAFPRLNLFSCCLYAAGALFILLSMVLGGLDTGWTLYVPYGAEAARAGLIPALTGILILGFSSIFTGINFIVTVHKLRPPGMGWFRMPLFVWALYAAAIIQVLATPALGITLLFLLAEQMLGVGIFDSALGGGPLLFQHLFWFSSHPAVYITILPAMGIVSEVISIHSRKHIFGYKFVACNSIAVAALGFLAWGQHMFVSGQSAMASMIFSALAFSVAVPLTGNVCRWLATLFRGSIRLTTPMCYALMFIALFGIGGLTGLFLGALATDAHLHDTYFVVAHFHFAMVPVMLAFLGGLHHWWPKITGRMFNDNWGRVGCLVISVGVVVTFFTQFILGSRGMPRRCFNYPAQFQTLQQISTIGAYVMSAGLAIAAATLARSLLEGPPAPANPWGGATLEWRCGSPPPHDNFATTPQAGDPYDFSGLEFDPAIGGYGFRSGLKPPFSPG